MDVSELPMILFTVIAQMCVGAFLVLGVVQTFGALKFRSASIDRIADPALLAIGPAMVLGLLVSMLHMHDITHTFNVVRHWNSSWLSREIIFGCAFAGLGFVFALLQWRKWGSPLLRRVLAAITALVGVGLILVMSNIYYALTPVPAWHSWFTFVQFFGTAILLGSLLMGLAFVAFTRIRRDAVESGATHAQLDPKAPWWLRFRTPSDAEMRAEVNSLLPAAIRGIAIAALVTALVLLVATPVYLSGLAAQGGVALESAKVFTGTAFVLRLICLVVGAGLLGVFAYLLASSTRLTPLLITLTAAVVVALSGEFIGRALFYLSNIRVGL